VKITFDAAFAADVQASSETRQISGKIVPLGNEVGNTSAGKVIFERGSIQIPEPKTVKLLSQHDVKAPLGRAQSFTETDDAIYASFKISNSSRGTDALILASEGLQAGLSVGVEVIKSSSKKGIIHVSQAKLMEVSLVTEPAFRSSQVTEIAAEESEEVSEVVEETQPSNESETAVENTPETVAAPEVEAAAVEAARPTVSVTSVRERVAPLTSGQYLDAQIKAAMGDDNARRTILAADDSVSTNTGLTLPGHLQQFVTTTFTGRPAFEAVTRQALPDSSMSFTIPKLGTAPTVAETAEASAPSETGMTSTYDTVTVKQYSGLNRISTILLDRSSPAFMDLLMTEMRKAYEKATDEALIAAFTASGTQATGVAATAAGLQSFIATQSAAAYKATGGNYANKLVASTDQWAAINGYVDGSSRPLYSAQGQTQNASGAVVPTSVVGNVLGTSLIVDHNISVSGIVDESAFLVAPESVYVWESPTTNLRVNVLTTSEVEISLYGYMAIGVLKGGVGVRRFNLS
jgi:HK97 family phage prohead protease